MFLFIERLIQLLVLFSILRSALRFVGGFRRGLGPERRRDAAPPPQNAAAGQGLATVLQPDPVCGTYVSIEASLKKIVNGKVYHFCSPECREKFTG